MAGKNGAMETCAVWSEGWTRGTVMRYGFSNFSGDWAWVSHTTMQNWHVGNSSESVNPILEAPQQVTEVET